MVYLEIKKKIPLLNAARVRRFTQGVLRKLGKSHMDVSLVLTNDREIHRFNRKYLNHNRPTDVLAFNLDDRQRPTGARSSGAVPLLGDIMISTERAKIYAKRFKNTFWNEVKLYIVHGILHLLGYDDHKAGDRAGMRRKEKEILKNVKG